MTEGLAAKACNDADAAALRRAGMAGSLRELRALAMLDRIAGRNPLDRLTTPQDPGPHDSATDPADSDDSATDPADNDGDQPGDDDRPSPAGAAAGGLAPVRRFLTSYAFPVLHNGSCRREVSAT